MVNVAFAAPEQTLSRRQSDEVVNGDCEGCAHVLIISKRGSWSPLVGAHRSPLDFWSNSKLHILSHSSLPLLLANAQRLAPLH